MRPRLLGIAGATCSGKTTLERKLAEHYKPGIDILPFDDMCIPYQELGEVEVDDWEQPHMYKFDEYVRHLRALADGQAVTFAANSWQSYQEGIKERTVWPRRLVVSVGFLAMHDQRARELFDNTIFIDIPEEVIEERRVARDSAPGFLDEEGMREYVHRHILPAHRQYVVPQAGYANVIIDGTLSEDEVLARVLEHIEQP